MTRPNGYSTLSEHVSLEGFGTFAPFSFLLEIGDDRFSISAGANGVTITEEAGINASWDFSFSLSDEDWASFCLPKPPRGHTSAQALVAVLGPNRIRGSRIIWARSAPIVDRIFAALRSGDHAPKVQTQAVGAESTLSPIVGRYLNVEVDGSTRRIYFETAGRGIPVVCLHTAGSDSRQFRYLLEDESLTDKFQFYAFDMPWHGRSAPPDDWPTSKYVLTTDVYAETVLSVIGALELRSPILLGCSMGAAIGLYLASTNGDRFTGVCALEGGLGNPGRLVDWTNRLDVDHSYFLTSWIGGAMAPASPLHYRNRTIWGYAQSGPGVYQGDIFFYANDLPKVSPSLGKATCPVYVFSGEFDYVATSEMGRFAVDQLGGEFIQMENKGHFPMAEDPDDFAHYLIPVLEKLGENYSK